ncbi:hypothetical protein NQ315_004146 [Exocentrus adspersus]|uniref:non-specific serine/threonine protein kinase n=1 Tax=Exocentrus adspersus TaxID=1586481 RepID=A0AAV8W6T6_9CUCU|nr:hypothetical protein NQ315_004146 [Exocentrus adspersus]
MPRRCNDSESDDEPPRKKGSSGISNGIDIKEGEVVSDILGKKWKLGKPIGIGGFGQIFQAADKASSDTNTNSTSYVAKIERHKSGPLFVEINCYLRIAKPEIIEEWKRDRNLSFLGMPHYIASGSHAYRGEKYRFLILPRYEKDLQEVFQEKKVFNLKTVLVISTQILDVLEYIHSQGYVHSDIKASNIMLGKPVIKSVVPSRREAPLPTRVIGTRGLQKRRKKISVRNLRPIGNVNYIDDIPYLDEVLNTYNKNYNNNIVSPKREEKRDKTDRVYLLDYGLASKYVLVNGQHREFCRDERRAHAGTVLFCSRDAHKGVPSRRSDLESLAYNMVYWLTGSLPWLDDVDQPDVVEKKKIRCFKDLKNFLEICFNNDYPSFLLDYFNYLNELQFETPYLTFKKSPDYEYIRKLFSKAIRTNGYKNDSKLDFENLESAKSRQKKGSRKLIGCENKKLYPTRFLMSNPLMPLDSNIIFKRPKLRKKVKNKKIKDSAMNWSKILMDPETIMKQATKERKTEGSDLIPMSLTAKDLNNMNPTYAMLEVFNKCKDRDASPKHKGDSPGEVDNIDGYTPAMMSVYKRMKERQELEYEQAVSSNTKVNSKSGRCSSKRRLTKRVKRSESPTVAKPFSRVKSLITVLLKKETVQLKKGKTIPPRRTYSLRG